MLADADRAKEIFLRAIAIGDRTERGAFVAQACGGDPELRGWVDGLLAAFDRAAAFAPPSSMPTADFTPVIESSRPGDDGGATDLESAHPEVAADLPPKRPDPMGTTDYDSNPVGPGRPESGDLNATTDFPVTPLDPSATSAYESNPDPVSPSRKTVRGSRRTVGDRSGGSADDSDSPSDSGREPEDMGPGSIIDGRYTLVGIIGEGGMGSVYLAQQSEPIRREVAIKLIKAGFDSRTVLARFAAERQALALMEHPNIARVYDGGTTAAGTPYFAMELVRGVPITQYCDARRLPPAERLDLFVKVCRAVQHAHQKGIIHRDLKPGNILVTDVDGRPTPKVIDFGVAKATEQPLTDQSFSDVGAIVGTPVYMSPEQADPSTMDVDTRTDVYALGVVLYELLTGTPPIRAKDFKRGALLEMLRMVREVEPPRPSTRASSDDALPSIAANRALEPGQLLSLLRGDIDWVVMKALEKDRERRYESANGLASDIERYLASETVSARLPTRAYRLRKFARRNRAAVAVGTAFAALFFAGVVGVVVQWREAVFQRAQAVAAKADAEKNFGVALEQRMVALKALGQVLDISRRDLPNLPGTQDVRKKVLGIARASLANIAENPLVQISLKDSTLAAVYASAGNLQAETGELKEGFDELREAEAIFERIVQSAPDDREIGTARQDLALIKMDLAQISLKLVSAAESRRRLDEALVLMGDLGRGAPADFRRNQANLLMRIGADESRTDPRRARDWYVKSLRISEEIAEDHPSNDNSAILLSAYLLVGMSDFKLRDPASGEKYYRLAVKIADGEAAKPKQVGWKRRLATARERLGDLLLRTGRPAEARKEFTLALEIYEPIAKANEKIIQVVADYSRILYSLAMAEEKDGAKAEAAAHYRASREIREARVKAKSEPFGLRDLMISRARERMTDEAAKTADEILAQFGSDPDSLLDVACCYAICYGANAGDNKAEGYAVRAIDVLKRVVQLGYRDIVNLETEPDLDALRARDDFKKFLADVGNRIR